MEQTDTWMGAHQTVSLLLPLGCDQHNKLAARATKERYVPRLGRLVDQVTGMLQGHQDISSELRPLTLSVYCTFGSRLVTR